MDLTRHRHTKQLERHLDHLFDTVFPSVVALGTYFIGPENQDLKQQTTHDTGVFVDPTTIVTSAKVIGRVFAEKPDGSDLHRCYLAHTAVISRDKKPLKTWPWAVSFAHDVAVLKLAAPPPEEEQISFPFCRIAKSPPGKGEVLLAIVHMLNLQFGKMPGHVRAVGERTLKSKAPWPLDDGSGWVEFDNSQFNGGFPRPWSDLFKSEEVIVGEMSGLISGCPLFNYDGEFFGLGSWSVSEKGSSRPITYGASLLPIKVVLEYAKNKKPTDPIVMDNWIQDYPRMDFNLCAHPR